MALPVPPPGLSQVTAAELAVLLNIGSPTAGQTATMNLRLAGAVASISAYLGFDFTPAEATEYYDGYGQETIVLNRKWVTAVGPVYLDWSGEFGQGVDPFPTSTLLVEGIDYAWRNSSPSPASSLLYRLNGPGGTGWSASSSWPVNWRIDPTRLAPALTPVRGCIRVTYTAGLGTIATSVTNATTAGAGAVILTSAATASMVGQTVQIVSGTNFVTGAYAISAADPGVSITTSIDCATGVGASGVLYVGGLFPDVLNAIYYEAAALMYSPTGFGMQTSESYGGRSVGITPFGRPRSWGLNSPIAETMLQRYRSFAIALNQ